MSSDSLPDNFTNGLIVKRSVKVIEHSNTRRSMCEVTGKDNCLDDLLIVYLTYFGQYIITT